MQHRQKLIQPVTVSLQHLKREHQFAVATIRTLQATAMTTLDEIDGNHSTFLGQHMLAEFKVSANFKNALAQSSHPQKLIHQIIVSAAKRSGATILTDAAFLHTNGYDVCAIVPVEESHYAAHYQAQRGMLALDAFTCGKINFMQAVNDIQDAIGAQPYDTANFKRGIRSREDNKFIPGIAVMNNATMHFFKPTTTAKQFSSLGQHMIAEFYYCNTSKINDANTVIDAFTDALEAGNAHARYHFVHQFQPQGITAVMCGDGFHLTIHDWPEFGYASIDFCVFDTKVDCKQVMAVLTEHFDPRKTSVLQFPRGNFSLLNGDAQPIFADLAPVNVALHTTKNHG